MSRVGRSRGASFGLAALAILVVVGAWLWDRTGPRLDEVDSAVDQGVQARSDDEPRLAVDEGALDGAQRRDVPGSDGARANPPEDATESGATPSATTLFGQLVDTDGRPHGGDAYRARIQVSGYRASDGEHVSQRRVETDAEGHWSAGPVPAGRWTVAVQASNCYPAHATVEIPEGLESLEVPLVVEPMQLVDVVVLARDGSPGLDALSKKRLESMVGSLGYLDGSLETRVGAPRREILPVALSERPGATVELGNSSPNEPHGIGQFWHASFASVERPAEGGYFGRLTVRERGPFWVALVVGGRVHDVVPATGATEEVVLTLDVERALEPAARLKVRVVDALTGDPLLARVRVSGRSLGSGEATTEPSTGVAVVKDAPHGERSVFVSADGYARSVSSVTVPITGRIDMGTIELDRPVRIEGVVRRSDGTPAVARMRAGRVDERTNEVMWDEEARCRSDPSGRFEFTGLAPGRWVVQVQPPSIGLRSIGRRLLSRPVRVEAWHGTRSGVEVTAEPATLVTFRLQRPTGPYSSAHVLDENGRSVDSVGLGLFGREGRVALLPGTYRVELRQLDALLDEREIAVDAEPLVVELGED